MKFIGVNGMSHVFGHNTGAGTTDRMLAALRSRGHQVHDFDYEPVYVYGIRSWRKQMELGERLAAVADPGDVLLAHSMGGLIGMRSMEAGAEYSAAFLFRPAAPARYSFPAHAFRRCCVIHCRSDEALAKGAKLWRHPFGKLGSVGYQPPPRDERVVNVPVPPGIAALPLNHSVDFEPPFLEYWVRFIEHELSDLDCLRVTVEEEDAPMTVRRLFACSWSYFLFVASLAVACFLLIAGTGCSTTAGDIGLGNGKIDSRAIVTAARIADMMPDDTREQVINSLTRAAAAYYGVQIPDGVNVGAFYNANQGLVNDFLQGKTSIGEGARILPGLVDGEDAPEAGEDAPAAEIPGGTPSDAQAVGTRGDDLWDPAGVMGTGKRYFLPSGVAASAVALYADRAATDLIGQLRAKGQSGNRQVWSWSHWDGQQESAAKGSNLMLRIVEAGGGDRWRTIADGSEQQGDRQENSDHLHRPGDTFAAELPGRPADIPTFVQEIVRPVLWKPSEDNGRSRSGYGPTFFPPPGPVAAACVISERWDGSGAQIVLEQRGSEHNGRYYWRAYGDWQVWEWRNAYIRLLPQGAAEPLIWRLPHGRVRIGG